MWASDHAAVLPLRIGIVRALDAAAARVRVVFADHDQMQSWWLPVVVPKAQSDKVYWMPDIGEQVVCLMDEHDEAGAVLGAIYSSADPAPVSSPDKFHLGFHDGTVIEYDRVAHSLNITLCAEAIATVGAPGGITLKSGGSQVTVSPAGVAISPPLPISSTVAQT